jgi:hypothetical protein
MDEPVIKAATETSGSPAEFLKNVVGKQVKVRIGSGIDYEGQSSIFRLRIDNFSPRTPATSRYPVLLRWLHECGNGEHS